MLATEGNEATFTVITHALCDYLSSVTLPTTLVYKDEIICKFYFLYFLEKVDYFYLFRHKS